MQDSTKKNIRLTANKFNLVVLMQVIYICFSTCAICQERAFSTIPEAVQPDALKSNLFMNKDVAEQSRRREIVAKHSVRFNPKRTEPYRNRTQGIKKPKVKNYKKNWYRKPRMARR